MQRYYAENELFETALKALENNLNLPIAFAVNPAEQYCGRNIQVDKVLQIKFCNREINFCVEIKTTITKPVIGQLLLLKDKLPHPLLLVTDYVTDYIACILKQNGIEFIDTAGNAFIKQPPVYVFIKGNRPPMDVLNKIPRTRAFRPTGIKAIFAFLCDPDLVNRPYREIAATAGIALGNVGWIIKDLKYLGYIADMGRHGLKLTQKEQLINRWVTEYPEKLKPKLFIGKFNGDTNWWRQNNLNNTYAQWGGEVAAAILTKHLKPQNITVYAKQAQLDDLLVKNKLRKDINGNIEVFARFWTPAKEDENKNTVHPILIYADLLATGNQRNIETAKIIYEKYILRHIGQD